MALISKNPDGEEGETTVCDSVLSVDATYASLLVVKNIRDNTDEEGSCDSGSDSDVFNDEEINDGGYGVSINEVDEISNESMQFQVNEPTNSPNIPISSIHHADPISISETRKSQQQAEALGLGYVVCIHCANESSLAALKLQKVLRLLLVGNASY
ncbi:hypothetical protein IW261DRAFT_1597087 [Armillaria novae-zelandiae]|uniref:Uncharacterized protein n=1 Tax=Armillaria novae-zelandiae TaxID=153914 RepID=A0AA39NUP0_9AGAR|nr:hypothetical protein IW261DRAFT_1597087 [Armillaria novae-zelandiae]